MTSPGLSFGRWPGPPAHIVVHITISSWSTANTPSGSMRKWPIPARLPAQTTLNVNDACLPTSSDRPAAEATTDKLVWIRQPPSLSRKEKAPVAWGRAGFQVLGTILMRIQCAYPM